jgi:peptide/nickel transport system permease protein
MTILADHPIDIAARQLFWRRFRQHRLAVLSALLLAFIAAMALLAPVIEGAMGLDATRVDLFNQYALPGATHWLGTDEAGRDVFLRLLYGGRVSLLVALVAAIAEAVIGTTIGLCAGYYGGRLDALLMRTTGPPSIWKRWGCRRPSPTPRSSASTA